MKGWELSKKNVILQYIKKFNISIKKKSLTSAALVKRNENDTNKTTLVTL